MTHYLKQGALVTAWSRRQASFMHDNLQWRVVESYAPELSAQRIAQVIENLTTEQSGKLLHWDGTELPY